RLRRRSRPGHLPPGHLRRLLRRIMATATYADPAAEHPTWEQLVRDAINEPGTISQAYSVFHSYSLGNQLLALFQCVARGIRPGPVATFMHWKALGRSVRKGEKALTLG